jgi:hypothetical protein
MSDLQNTPATSAWLSSQTAPVQQLPFRGPPALRRIIVSNLPRDFFGNRPVQKQY